ncbi:hypothetical protein ES703_41120 [subsurface metagenome]
MTEIVDPGELHFERGIWGYDDPDWRPVIADAAGQLQVVVAAFAPGAATPALYNVTMTLAATEYNRALPANCQKFTIKCRTNYAIQLAFTAAQSGVTYLTIPPGMAYSEDMVRPAALTLYFQCPTAAQVAEIVAWS